ncbi:MAG: hypothetical protein ACREL1_03910 [bacterium]
MNPILRKLFFRGQSPILLLGVPGEFKKTVKNFGVPIHSQAKGQYDFILAFVKSLAEGEQTAKILKTAAAENAVIWVGYPKGTSSKYKSDYNRDAGHALMAQHDLDGVSLISLDADWSAMRFKIV